MRLLRPEEGIDFVPKYLKPKSIGISSEISYSLATIYIPYFHCDVALS